MNEIWNEICFELKEKIQNNALEKEYESAVCHCLMLLGWKKFKGEIVTQYPVQAGHENKYADIVVLQNNVEQFVIEIKRPNHILQEEDERQLFSYMRLLKHQAIFGLYVGDKIHLYYDDIASQQLPEQVLSLDIEENNPEGLKFVELFSRDQFCVQVLTDFCQEQKAISQKHKQMQNEIARILADTEGQMFKDALKEKYLNEGHTVEWADSVLDQICVSISPAIKRTIQVEAIPPSQQSTQNIEKPIVLRDKTKYSFLGNRPMSKRVFVFNVIKHFVTENPKSYAEFSKILNALKPDAQGVIKAYDSLTTNQYRNYFVRESDFLTSADGVKFVVCNQWGLFNIGPIIRFANSLGYNVVEYK